MSTVPQTLLIPRTVLFGNPTQTSPRISPDGKRLAYLAPVNNVLNIWVGDLNSDNAQPVTNDTDRGIRSYFWAADNIHILYIQDVGGNENWRLYATNLETQETHDLTPFPNVQARVIENNKHFPNELLIGLNKDNPQVHDVYHLDLATQELRLLEKNPGNVIGWVVDANLQVRAALTTRPDAGRELLVRRSAQDQWQSLITWNADDALNSTPVGFTFDGQSLYIEDSRNVNAGRLIKLNLTTNEQTVMAEDEQYDVGNVILHPDSYEVQAVSFVRDRTEWQVLDPTIQKDFTHLQELRDGDFLIVSRDDADQVWIVAYIIDNGPVYYYSYNRKEQTVRELFSNQPELENYTLTHMQPISFTARDGLTIHGYLALPTGEHQKPLPLVLNVHGGPWARDTWGYNPEVQWLTNRGYACLKINYRGSTGYGKHFLNAGNREWAGKMHDDLIDGVNWAIQQGIADPKKVAIYGGSYGGYAALVGATFTPDVFCCAVDIVGPSNLLTLLRSFPPYWSTFMQTWYTRLGHPDTDEQFLKERSPLFKVDQIKIPLLIAQGANDPRVTQAESEQIVAALQ